VHSKVYGGRFQGEKVRIAILDTGLELSQDQSDNYEREEKIVYKSWIGENEEGYPNGKDDVGHGTHLATLLVQVARYAHVHVARVFKESKPNMQRELQNVAKVSQKVLDILQGPKTLLRRGRGGRLSGTQSTSGESISS
jgi:hypothetical protein